MSKKLSTSNKYIIRIGHKSDYRDIVKLGYPFNQKFLLFDGLDLMKFLYGKELIGLAAYFPEDNVTAGFLKLQKITNNLWGIWGTYVAPQARRKGVASNLYDEAFTFFKKNYITKCIGSVSYKNVPSLENLKKTWDGFLDRIVYVIQPKKNRKTDDGLFYKNIEKKDDEKLYNIFQNNVGYNWINYLEVNRRNFLERIFGSASCESYSNGFLRRSIIKIDRKKIVNNEKLLGYYITSDYRFGLKNLIKSSSIKNTYIFMKNFNDLKSILYNMSWDVVKIIGTEETHEQLINIGVNIVDKYYICYKNII